MAAKMFAAFSMCAFVLSVSATLEEECNILTKLDSLETRLQEQEINLREYQIRLREQEVRLAEKNIRIGDLERSMTEKDTRIGGLERSMTEKDTRIGDLERSMTEKDTRIGDLERNMTEKDTRIGDLEKRFRPAQAVGFSVRSPVESQTSRQMAFRDVITDEGGGFNHSSGVFICPVSGLYYFSAALLKSHSFDGSAYCSIYRNNDYIVTAYTNPGHTPRTGEYAAVSGAYARLAVGDTVKLASCTSSINSAFYSFSSYSGFLVTQDN